MIMIISCFLFMNKKINKNLQKKENFLIFNYSLYINFKN